MIMAMSVPKLIQSTRIRRGLSVGEVASRIGVSPSMLKKYEAGLCPIPQDVVVKAARVLQAPIIKKQFTWEHNLSVINTPVLNRIDTHPVVMLTKLSEEVRELLEDVTKCADLLVNKRSREDLSTEELGFVRHTMAEFFDVCCGGEHFVVEVCDMLEIDLDDELAQHAAKCQQKGYIRNESQPGKVVALYPAMTPSMA